MSASSRQRSRGRPLQSKGEDVYATPLTDGLMMFVVEPRAGEHEAGPDAPAHPLSPSEWAVARLAARGLSTSEIARTRRSSPRTVANHLASVYRKLGVSGRRELRAYLLGHGTLVAQLEADS